MDALTTYDPTGTDDRQSRILRLADGRRIGYAEFGDPHGRPAIAIHGTPGSRLTFVLADQGARARGLRIVAPDRPGYGLSDLHRRDKLHETASDIEAIADALELDRFALIGLSGGAPNALAAAAAMAERVPFLALVGPVGPVDECRGQVSMSGLHRLLFTRIGARFAPRVAYYMLMQRVSPSDRAVLARPEVKAYLETAVGEGFRPGTDGALQDLRLFCAPWGLPLAEIDVPCVLWQGSDDMIVPPEAAYYLAQVLPNCRLDVIQQAGHYWIFDQFGRVLDAVQAALHPQ
jgi:pimeloyl-ACP methyl ester carboxylesterase